MPKSHYLGPDWQADNTKRNFNSLRNVFHKITEKTKIMQQGNSQKKKNKRLESTANMSVLVRFSD